MNPLFNMTEVDRINVSALADDVVFTLGDLLRSKKINKDTISRGIELCEAILRGKKVKPEQMKIEEVVDYEKYKLIENKREALKIRGLEPNTLLQKAEDIKSTLKNILNNEFEVKEEIIKESQKFFTTISLLFWRNSFYCSNETEDKGLEISG